MCALCHRPIRGPVLGRRRSAQPGMYLMHAIFLEGRVMRNLGIFRAALVWVAAIGACCPQMATSAPNTPVSDIALRNGGVLIGQVVAPQGSGLPDSPVSIAHNGKKLATSKTDKQGRFAFSGLRGGLHQVTAPDCQLSCRLWQPGTAPPAAQQGAVVVSGGQTVRGQLCCLGLWLRNPLIVGALIATAIAVPVGIHNSKKSPSSP